MKTDASKSPTAAAGTCILISKDELDSLEQALEILSTAGGVRRMRERIAGFATCALVAE